jgi:putative thioredoxin
MTVDVTDATFQTEIIERSMQTPVVVDLWAPWCGPCQTIGPILERVIEATGGKVVLAKVNVDENPAISQAFEIQSIPAVYALKDGVVADGFVGAYPEHVIEQFVLALLPTEESQLIDQLLAVGDEASLRQALTLDGANEDVIVALAELLVEQLHFEEALAIVARIPESDRTRRVAAAARLGQRPADNYDEQLDLLLDQVKADDDARQQFVDILELMGPDDPRTAQYRKRLTTRLY